MAKYLSTSQLIAEGIPRALLYQIAHRRGQTAAIRPTPTGKILWDVDKLMRELERMKK